MTKERKDMCPGCSRHCTAGNEHCKYGRKYFGEKQKTPENGGERKQEPVNHQRKWEKHVTAGSPVWKLLWTASRSKRALRRKECTEQELLSLLDEVEQAQLDALLQKILVCTDEKSSSEKS